MLPALLNSLPAPAAAVAHPIPAPLQKFTGSALSGLSSFAANMSEAAARNATQAAAESALQKQVRLGALAATHALLFSCSHVTAACLPGPSADVNASANPSCCASCCAVQAATAYLEALQQLQPPMTSQSRWEELAAAAALPDAPQFAVLSDIKRELVFKTYVDALVKAERVARTQALAAFQVGPGCAALVCLLCCAVADS